MNTVKGFEEFIKEGVVKVQAPDKSRAKFLITESGNSYRLLSELMEKSESAVSRAVEKSEPKDDMTYIYI